MAKLYFNYSAMNAGKSTVLLQASYNYREQGLHTLLLKPEVDNRGGSQWIHSRIGLRAKAISFSSTDDLFQLCADAHQRRHLDAVLVDEAQFMTQSHVDQLCDVADRLGIPVLTYGLRTDFRGDLFEGSKYLLAWADSLNEIKTICHCGRKAIMVVRVGPDGQVVREGAQVEVGGNDRYISVCRRHHRDGLVESGENELPLEDHQRDPQLLG